MSSGDAGAGVARIAERVQAGREEREDQKDLGELNDYLFGYLRDVMYSPSQASLDLNRLPRELRQFGQGLQYFGQCAIETAAMAKALSKGTLNISLPSQQNEMAAPLKSLHAALNHLTWQTKQVANGDYTQRVGFMGDFADAFNIMVQLLDERWRSLGDLYRRNSAYIRLIHKMGENLLSIGETGYGEAMVRSLGDLCETLDCAILSLWKRNGERGRLERLFYWPAGERGVPFMITADWPEEWLSDLAAGKYVSTNDMTVLGGLFAPEVHSFLAIPLLVGGNFWGFLAMPGLRQEEKAYTEEEISVMMAGGMLIVSAVIAKEMTDSLVAAREDALRAARVKSEFLSRMSHEMRTPMNAIIGMTGIARAAKDEKKLRFCLSTIETSSRHLLNLINDVLDISKIEAGKLELNTAPFGLEEMLVKVCSIIEEGAEQKKQTLNVIMKRGTEARYIGDAMRLSQVVTNLFSNAVKFTPERGKILLTVEETERSEMRARLRFSVSDTGIGMTPDQMSRLFRAFGQADASITRRYGGTGLGLAISKKIVEQMNGRIEASSEPGEGSSFVFEVELERDPARDAKRAVFHPEVRVLIVEDDPDALEQFRAVTEDSGVVTDAAGNREQAVSFLESAILSDRPYDVILVDADLPGGGGIESVRSFGPAVDRDTVALIAPFLKWDAVEEEANRAGIYRFLAKPIFPSSVWGVIDGLRRMEDGDDVCDSDVSGAAKPAPDLSGKRILLTDDVDINRLIVIELLSETNAEIAEAESGAETLSMFEASPENYYNLVLMDIQMPGMDGYETTQRLRELPRPDAKTVPIIALTANAYKEDAERALASGMDGYLAKPIDIGKVFDILAKYLKEERK